MIPTFGRRLYYKIRKMLFTRERPKGPFLAVDADKDKIVREFGQMFYGPNWALSYNFRGEIVNLARINYHYDPKTDIDWWQVHVRGWTGEDGLIYLRGHYEAEPTEYPSQHLDGTGYNLEHGMMILEKTLEASDITVKKRVSEMKEL